MTKKQYLLEAKIPAFPSQWTVLFKGLLPECMAELRKCKYKIKVVRVDSEEGKL